MDIEHCHEILDKEFIHTNLLKWYDKHRRKLPWRGDFPPFGSSDQNVMLNWIKPPKVVKQEKVSPYGTWVSEIMLQQTRVDTVVGYYLKWMEEFPTVKALADADAEKVNSLWAGLGYYRRARMLHAGAKYVVEELDGRLPESVVELQKIPGIGPYTAGAIASIAFNVSEPLLDGNVIRVLSRYCSIYSDPKNPKLVALCWAIARSIVHQSRAGDFNQALMELGATICTTKNPKCKACPIQQSCVAYKDSINKIFQFGKKPCAVCEPKEGNSLAVIEYPRKAKKTKQREEIVGVMVVAMNIDGVPNFLVQKRPENGLLAGQHEFLAYLLGAGSKVPEYEDRAKSCEKLLTASLGDSVKELLNKAARQDGGELLHVFSHIKHYMGIELIVLPGNTLPTVPPCATWMTMDMLNEVGLTTGMKKVHSKVIKLLRNTKRQKKM